MKTNFSAIYSFFWHLYFITNTLISVQLLFIPKRCIVSYVLNIFIFDFADNQKRFAEITVVYHCMNDFEEARAQGKVLAENAREDLKICNYRYAVLYP